MRSRGRLAWIPVFLLGFVAATAAELAGGLLLYSDEGFLRALTLLLSVELGALGAGLWAGRPAPARDPLETARRRWLFCLVTYTAAAGFAAAWQMTDGLSSTFLNQGLGLGLLGGLPLYGAGSALAALTAVEETRPRPGPESVGPARRRLPLGAVAALGGAAGVAVTGLVLIPRVRAVSIFLLCVVLVSVGALLHGWILEAWWEEARTARPAGREAPTSGWAGEGAPREEAPAPGDAGAARGGASGSGVDDR